MASTKLVFNEDEVRRLQSKIGQVSQETNRLYLQLKGQSSSWGGIPMGDQMVRAQVLINELTVEAEKLEDIIRVALRGVSELQEENKRQADKLTGQFNLFARSLRKLGTATSRRTALHPRICAAKCDEPHHFNCRSIRKKMSSAGTRWCSSSGMSFRPPAC
ncbi:hypothetical protein ACFTAO_40985 [Paenibacillus rhizoplanae]